MRRASTPKGVRRPVAAMGADMAYRDILVYLDPTVETSGYI
jgi:hypothetical protein